MNRNLTLFLVCGALLFNMQAQNFGGGLIAGLSTSQVAGDNLAGFNKIGMMAGAFVTFPQIYSENIKLQLEIIYIEKGSLNPNFHENNIAEITLSYVEIPISIILQQTENIGIHFGILPSYNTNAEMNDYRGEIPIDPTFKKYDFGAFAGMNYHLSSNIILNSKISNSIIPIRPHVSGATTWLNKGQYNTVLSFAIQYTIK